jgi:hypothetical protein
MITLLLESVPVFRETWTECLGDLSRYRMAVEEFDKKDRELWAGVSRYWYNQDTDLEKIACARSQMLSIAWPGLSLLL